MRRGRAGRAGIALVALAAAGVGAAGAQAATVTVTGDDGNPAALAPGVPGATRVMTPVVETVTPGWVAVSVTGPDGAPATTSTTTCSIGTQGLKRFVDYRGNGAYTVQVTEYGPRDYDCTTPTVPTATYSFSINAGVTLPQPTKTFLTRVPGSFTTRALQMAVAPNPGSSGTEILYKRNAKLGPDGGIQGTALSGLRRREHRRRRGPAVSACRASTRWSRGPRPAAPPAVERSGDGAHQGAVRHLAGELPRLARDPAISSRGTCTTASPAAARSTSPSPAARRAASSARSAPPRSRVRARSQSASGKTSPGQYRIRYIFKGSTLVAGGRETRGVRITRRTFYS